MDFLRLLFKRHRTAIIASALLGVVSGASCSAVIALVHQTLKGDRADTGAIGLAFAGLIAAYFVLSSYSEYLLVALSQKEFCELRVRLSRHILTLPLRRIEEIGPADLFASLTSDIEKLVTILRKLPALFVNAAMILGAGAYMAWLSWRLFLLSFLFLAVGIVLYLVPLYRFAPLQRYWVSLRDGWDELCRHFHSLTHGAKELLIHRARRETFLKSRLAAVCRKIQDQSVRGKTIQNILFRWGDTLYLIVLGILLFVLAPRMALENQILTGYVMAGLFVITPLASVLDFVPNFGEAAVALMRLRGLGMSFAEELPEAAGEGAIAIGGASAGDLIRLAGIRYTYHDRERGDAFTLGPLDLTVREGETLFIVGGNGSGKTTLLKLLCGLYSPDEGTLLWRGEPVTGANREAYRQFFSVVFSDFYLFDTLFGLEPFDLDDRARQFLAHLQLEGKLTVAGGRLSTVDLSQGQRKRLALLVAYLEDRPVYIFDEWAADQDPLFKRVFYNELLPEMKAKGKTLLVITHDESWFDRADRIVKLRDGRIAGDEGGRENAG
jgi:putative pyoverdin transport system ATP-binding/permease protein